MPETYRSFRSLQARNSPIRSVPDARVETAVRPRVGPAEHDWAVKLGERHGAQERVARQTAQAAHDQQMSEANAAQTRWPRIVEAITRLVAAYNEGAGREVITVSDDRAAAGGGSMVLRGGNDAATLSVTLEASALYARRPGSSTPSSEIQYRLSADRGDEATAAYVLQHWMAQLSQPSREPR
jgi:hypothetical protein